MTYREEPGHGWFVVRTDVPDVVFLTGGKGLARRRARQAAFHVECEEPEVEIVERVERATP